MVNNNRNANTPAVQVAIRIVTVVQAALGMAKPVQNAVCLDYPSRKPDQ